MIVSKYKLLVSSSLVFVLVNVLENYIHFTIGRSHHTRNEWRVHAVLPTWADVAKMTAVTVMFAALNAWFLYIIAAAGS